LSMEWLVRCSVGEQAEFGFHQTEFGYLPRNNQCEKAASIRMRSRWVAGVRRTLERCIRKWRAQYGPARDVAFPRTHAPGRFARFRISPICPAVAFPSRAHRSITGSIISVWPAGACPCHPWRRELYGACRGPQNALWALGGARLNTRVVSPRPFAIFPRRTGGPDAPL